MKILFVTPKLGAWATHGEHLGPNQLYAQWAAFIREKGFKDLEVLDCRAYQIEADAMISRIKEKSPDIVVIGDMLHSYGGFAILHYFLKSAEEIKKTLPSTKIIFGGLWFSSMPEYTLNKYPFVDYVVMGE
ncbi:MAG: hypothetical protein GF375_05650, partial [Candidatus Omnitrophica bacterium]|nr:hypothetical protein [Candidatus Omnitrophota bacterium]MBD3269472.1 hypothetical protein [Candidatus Omnitrophota bacterium]